MKPSLDEFVAYAERSARSFISKKISNLPEEIKEECMQEAFVRVLEVYADKLDPNEPWKGYCYRHATGAILDYLRRGDSFEENKWDLKENDKAISRRISPREDDDSNFQDVTNVLGNNGIFIESCMDNETINWPLLSRLASQDDNIKILGKHLLGFRNEEIKKEFNLTGERIGQIIAATFGRIREPSDLDLSYPPFRQLLYALGLTGHLDREIHDEGIGWSFEPVNLFEPEERVEDEMQLSLAL